MTILCEKILICYDHWNLNEVIVVAGRDSPPLETHHEETGPMRPYLQTMPCTCSPHDTLVEIPFLQIEDPTKCQTTSIALPRYMVGIKDFLSLFDVDVFCLVRKRSGHQSLTLEGRRSLSGS